MTDKEKILAFIEERIEWNKEMMSRDPKPSDIGRIEEAKCIMRFIDSLQENPCDGCINRKGCITCENGELRETMQEELVSIWHDSNKEQPNFASAVAIWNPKYENGEILSRCTEVYSDRIWAYIDDLLKM